MRNSYLINSIGDWVFEEVCSQVSKWQNDGFENLTYCINVSPRQLLQKQFPETIEKIIQSKNLSPAQFEIEITETILINQLSLSEKNN